MYQFSFHTGAIPTPIGLNNVRRDLCCFLLPHFHEGTVLLKGFSAQSLHCPAEIPLLQFATRTCLACPLPSLPCCVWAQRKLGCLFFLFWIAFYPFFVFSGNYWSKTQNREIALCRDHISHINLHGQTHFKSFWCCLCVASCTRPGGMYREISAVKGEIEGLLLL